jgi:hypothetical protein
MVIEVIDVVGLVGPVKTGVAHEYGVPRTVVIANTVAVTRTGVSHLIIAPRH